MILGKTVFVFGAGASHHAGAPLLNDFIDKAESLYEEKRNLECLQSFKEVFTWLRKLRVSRSLASLNLKNLEDVFSFALLLKEANEEDGESIYNALSDVILETLDQTVMYSTCRGRSLVQRGIWSDPVYSGFVDRVQQKNRERQSLMRENFSHDSFISFNYDVLLDCALAGRSTPYTYCLDGSEDGYKLLKLHGSINWAIHPQCAVTEEAGETIQTSDPQEFPWIESTEGTAKINLFHFLRKSKCGNDGCSYANSLKPVFVPPTWSKSALYKGFGNIWNTTIKEFEKAHQIVFVGYSLPDSDQFFRYLLARGLQNNGDLKRVIVTNISGKVIERYKRVIPSGIAILFHKGRFQDLSEQIHNIVYGDLYETLQIGSSAVDLVTA